MESYNKNFLNLKINHFLGRRVAWVQFTLWTADKLRTIIVILQFNIRDKVSISKLWP